MRRRLALAGVVATVGLSGLGLGLPGQPGPLDRPGGIGSLDLPGELPPLDLRADPQPSPAGLGGVGPTAAPALLGGSRSGGGIGRAVEVGAPDETSPVDQPLPQGTGPSPPPAPVPPAGATPRPTVAAMVAAGAEAVGAVATQATVAVPAWAEPPTTDATPPTWQIENPNEFDGVAHFLVQEQVGPWLRVQLPIRPNGIEGWIRADDVTLHPVDHRVEVVLDRRVLRVLRGDDVLFEASVAVGRPSAPTPVGRFYLRDLFPWDATSVYGAFVLPLSAYSEAIDAINGGEAVIAIHGTNRPEALGRAASLGCIRLDNATITTLAALIQPGTPVEIRP